ncbi:UNVERIFIED_CONTAM: hypothetical protein PYX00_006291 [Menopon gallinae]|uniref:Cilia-and flagella-associated protein 96 n=1 Tax=Menopon gallinae TaxID=328185 RepID=A0AAW2HVL6_9NEOP
MGKAELPELGKRFGRPDIERCDLFIDAGFLDWGKYGEGPKSRGSGKQMLSGVPSGGKKKCAIQAQSGYFETEFKTILVNDPYRDAQDKPKDKLLRGTWIPGGPSKRHATPGDYFGSFGKYSAFSPLTRPEKKKTTEELRNFTTRPGKKGNCGYLDITINKYPERNYMGRIDAYVDAEIEYKKKWEAHRSKIRAGPLIVSYPIEYFDKNPFAPTITGPTYAPPKEKAESSLAKKEIFYPPAAPKMIGGNHDGCFDKFPSWEPEPYITQQDAFKKLVKPDKKFEGNIFLPPQPIKSYYTCSVMKNKIDFACNERTWKTMKPISYPQYN